jgi:hypothetical protein
MYMPQLAEQVSEQQPIKKRKLPFGHYKVATSKEEVEIKPVSQEEMAEGWQAVLPRLNSGNPIHHWSVTLAQLPPHLWSKYRIEYEGNKAFCPVIKHNIYYYSINKTSHDDNLILLYKELAKGLCSDNNVIKELLSKLEFNADATKSNISGWLLIRAKKFLKNDKYNGDMDLYLSNI